MLYGIEPQVVLYNSGRQQNAAQQAADAAKARTVKIGPSERTTQLAEVERWNESL